MTDAGSRKSPRDLILERHRKTSEALFKTVAIQSTVKPTQADTQAKDDQTSTWQGGEDHFREYLKQGKRISQFTAKIWLNVYGSTATPEEKDEALHDLCILTHGSDQEIQALLKAKANVNLKELYGEVVITPNWNSFYASITELPGTLPGSVGFMHLALPIPPRPSKEVVSDDDLREWVNNQNDQECYPPYPYIPMSSGG